MRDPLDVLKSRLLSDGLSGGLEFLNRRVPHRFTAVYKLEGSLLRNVAIYDKQEEVVPDMLLTVPLEQSFCQFVLRDGGFNVGMTDTKADTLEGHVYQGVMNSYVGFPLTHTGADLFGTFCHFDFPALDVEEDEYAYLVKAARVLPTYVR